MFLKTDLDPSGNGDKKQKRGFLPDMTDEELDSTIRSLVDSQGKGDPLRALRILKKDNAKVRDLNRKLNEQVEKTTELSPDDAALLAATKKAKLTPETLGALMTENKELKASKEATEFATLVTQAAGELNSNVLKDQLTLNKMHLEMREIHVEETNDKKEKVVVLKKLPHVRPAADATAPLTPLNVWVQSLAKPYQEALKVKADGTKVDKKGTTSFTEFPEQPDGGKAPKQGRAVDNHLQAQYGNMPNIPGMVDSSRPAKQGA